MFISMPKPAQTRQTAVPQGKEGRQWQTEPGPVPGGRPGPGQQEAQSRGRKGVGEGGRSWRHQGGCPGQEEQKERGREGSRPVRAGLRLHVEHVGRALVVPVPEAGVAWALQLQDILFPEGQREKEGVEGRRDGREEEQEEGRKKRRKENGLPWLGIDQNGNRIGWTEEGAARDGVW